MDTVVDGERGDAASPGLVVDERPARVESDLRITTLAVDPHHARSGVMDPRLRIGIHLARPNRVGANEEPVESVGSAAVPFAGRNRRGDSIHLRFGNPQPAAPGFRPFPHLPAGPSIPFSLTPATPS